MTAARAAVLSILVATLAFSAACGGETAEVGGEEATVPEVDTETATDDLAEDVDVQGLTRELDDLERVVRDELSRLSEVRSLDDLSGRLESARSDLEQALENVRDADLSGDPDLERSRDELEAEVRDLSTQLEEAQAAVDERDLPRALSEVSAAVEGRQRLEGAIAELRRELDERTGE